MKNSFLIRNYKYLFILITGVKLLLAFYFPITGDEGYFTQWGKYIDLVYYDHPSLLGWWMWLARQLGHHIFFPRLLSIISSLVIAFGLFRLTKELTKNKDLALISALIYYTAPVNLLSFIISTDTPLVLFVFLTAWFFIKALSSQSHFKYMYFFSSALALGLAFWSKYLMFFMALAILFAILFAVQSLKEKLKVFSIFAVVGFLFIFIHFYWSSQNCWWSVMFNVFNRKNDISYSFKSFFTFAVYQIYLATPWVLYYLFKNYRKIKNTVLESKVLLSFYILPVVLLFIPSSMSANLHWALSYIPFVFIFVVILSASNSEQFPVRFIKYNLVLTLFHVLLLLGLIMTPDKYFSSNKFYADIVMGKYGQEIEDALTNYKSNYVFGTMGYTTGGLMEYHTDRHYLVFKDIDTNGRCDDKWTDYRALYGKNILLISTYKYRDYEVEELKNYFTQTNYEEINVRGAIFYIFKGDGFRYDAYRDGYISWAQDRFYKIPSWLPQGQCFLFDKYGDLRK